MSIVSPFIGDFLTPVGQPLVLSPLVNGLRAEFDRQQFRINGGGVLFDTAFNITRSSSKYVFGTGAQTGSLVETPPNQPAYKHDPVTGAPLGLSVEGSAVRLNTIAAAPTAAENVTVSAVQHTISFYGTGTMILSGAHSATVVGDGAFPTRTEYTFTATAGTLTLTPSGDIQHLQLETGAKATSPIIGNEGSQATRDADIVTSDAATFGDWFDNDSGKITVNFYVSQEVIDDGNQNGIFTLFDSSVGNFNGLGATIESSGSVRVRARSSTGSNILASASAITEGWHTLEVSYFDGYKISSVLDGVSLGSAGSVTHSLNVDSVYVGGYYVDGPDITNQQLNGVIGSLLYE